MAKKGKREIVKLVCSEKDESGRILSATRYSTTKNRQNEKLVLKKYDKALRRHVVFKEAK